MWILWLYGTVAVLTISLAGLAIIIILPKLQTADNHQSNLSQLFVGLAVGTLCADALLHLLPHAFSTKSLNHDDNVGHGDDLNLNKTTLESHHDHDYGHSHNIDSVWYGLLTLAGIIGFLFFERLTIIFNDLFNHRQNINDDTMMNDDEEHESSIQNVKCSTSATSTNLPSDLQKLNNHNQNNDHHQHEMKELSNDNNNDVMIRRKKMNECENNNNNNNVVQVHDECHRSTISYPKPNGDGYFHIASHHHHHHHHYRSHRGPSVALMVLMGDIVHNLFDGLAIGVAFAGSGISGGLSTSIAVLCHELPHELGDFTIIIRSGMKLRNAIYWNIVASITCWFGMCLGIFLGSIRDAWLSAIIGGTFLYISLVDMVPELDSCPHLPSKNRAIKLTVQMIGIAIGIAIMLFISLYENQFHTIFANDNIDHHDHHHYDHDDHHSHYQHLINNQSLTTPTSLPLSSSSSPNNNLIDHHHHHHHNNNNHHDHSLSSSLSNS